MLMVSCLVHDMMSCARNHVVGKMTCPLYEVMPSVANKRRWLERRVGANLFAGIVLC